MKCIYCLKNTNNPNHKCRSQQQQSMLDKNLDKIIDYFNQGYSLNLLVSKSLDLLGFDTTYDRLLFFCKRHNIQRRSIKEAANLKLTRTLYKNTLESKYGNGIRNISQVDIIKEKKKQVNMDRYGVENPFQREEVKNKIKETMLKKFGVENPIHIPGRKNFAHYTRLTKPHKKVSDWLLKNNISHLNDPPGLFRKYNNYFGRNYCPIPDIFIPDKKTIIEIYGDRWHMNPSIYKSSDIVRFFVGEMTAEKVWDNDFHRIEHLKSFSLDVIILWENEIKKNFSDVEQILQEKLCVK